MSTFHFVEIKTGLHTSTGHYSEREIRVYRHPRGEHGNEEHGYYRSYPFTPKNFWRAVGMLLLMTPPAPLPVSEAREERHEQAYFINGEVDYQSAGDGQALEQIY